MQSKYWVKKEPNNKVWWLEEVEPAIGEFVFSFDKVTEFNLFMDYPYKLTSEQKKIFDAENPYWADFFSDRQQKNTIDERPYFMKNKEWYFYDEEEGMLKLTEKAPEEAKKSYEEWHASGDLLLRE